MWSWRRSVWSACIAGRGQRQTGEVTGKGGTRKGIWFGLKYYIIDYFLFYVWVLCLHVCICTTCMPSVHRGQERVSDPLELELRMGVSHGVDSKDWTWVLCQTVSSLSNYWAISPAPGQFQITKAVTEWFCNAYSLHPRKPLVKDRSSRLTQLHLQNLLKQNTRQKITYN